MNKNKFSKPKSRFNKPKKNHHKTIKQHSNSYNHVINNHMLTQSVLDSISSSCDNDYSDQGEC